MHDIVNDIARDLTLKTIGVYKLAEWLSHINILVYLIGACWIVWTLYRVYVIKRKCEKNNN